MRVLIRHVSISTVYRQNSQSVIQSVGRLASIYFCHANKPLPQVWPMIFVVRQAIATSVRDEWGCRLQRCNRIRQKTNLKSVLGQRHVLNQCICSPQILYPPGPSSAVLLIPCFREMYRAHTLTPGTAADQNRCANTTMTAGEYKWCYKWGMGGRPFCSTTAICSG